MPNVMETNPKLAAGAATQCELIRAIQGLVNFLIFRRLLLKGPGSPRDAKFRVSIARREGSNSGGQTG